MELEKNTEPLWDREEVVILVENYFRTKTLPAERISEELLKVSDFLKLRYELINGQPASETYRNYAGIKMQTSRIKCLDTDNNLSGMHPTKLQEQIVSEYYNNKEAIITEASEIYNKYVFTDDNNWTEEYIDFLGFNVKNETRTKEILSGLSELNDYLNKNNLYSGNILAERNVKEIEAILSLTKKDKRIKETFLSRQGLVSTGVYNYLLFLEEKSSQGLIVSEDNNLSSAGWNLAHGTLRPDLFNEEIVWKCINELCSLETKISSSYKFVFFLAILGIVRKSEDNVAVSFDSVFKEFTREYWDLIGKYNIKQGSRRTHIEIIITNYVSKHGYCPFDQLLKLDELVQLVKKRCRTYVIGSLYSDLYGYIYGFSKSDEKIYFSAESYKFLKRNYEKLRTNVSQAWILYMQSFPANTYSHDFYLKVINANYIALGQSVGNEISAANSKDDTTDYSISNDGVKLDLTKMSSSEKDKIKITSAIMKYNEVGLYATQIADLTGVDKETIKKLIPEIRSITSKYQRYYYVGTKRESTLIDLLLDDILEEEKENDTDLVEDYSEEDEAGLMEYIEDSEELIRKIKELRGLD